MPSTNPYGFVYPLEDDGVDVPVDMLAMANSIGPYSNMRFTNATARDALLTAPVEGMQCWLQDLNMFTYYDGATWVTMIPGAYATYTPSIQATAGSPTLGNGTWTAARWGAVGKRVHAMLTLTAGSTTNFGTTSTFITLPVTARDLSTGLVGYATLFDVSAGAAGRTTWTAHLDTTARVNFVHTGDGSILATGSPIATLAAGDLLRIQFDYEAA